MRQQKKLITLFSTIAILLAFVLPLSSCRSNKVVVQSELKTKERMFWQIDALDANGKKSTVYIQGTIHMGDERLYPLSPVVMEAWNNADRIVGEISTNDWAVFQTEMQNRMIQSQIKNGGKNFLPKLNEKQKNVLYSILQKEGAEGLATFEPWVTTTAINTEVYLRSGLSVEKGMDGLFMISAYQQNKKMEGLDSLDTQFELLQFGTYDEQLTMLKDTLDALDENKTVTEYTKKMYEAYLANDLQTLSSLIQQGRIDDSKRNALYKNYYAQMFTERNKNWADKIEQYLKEGGTTFIFAGTGHFVGSDSVFAYLKSKGIAPLE